MVQFSSECPVVLEKMEPRRLSLLEPMIVDVILLRNSDYKVDIPLVATSGKQGFSNQIILERWTVKYEYRKSSTRDIHSGRISSGSGTPRWEDGKKAGGKIGPGKGRGLSGTGDVHQGAGGSQSSSPAAEVPIAYKKTYKRTLILLRSLYCTARLLPAYRLFRLANSSCHDCNFSLFHRVSSSPEPLSQADEAEMHSHNFTPVETPCGRICLSVSYRSTTAVTALEDAAPLLPEIITDYVGSPAAELPKRFPSDLTFVPGKKKVHMTTPPLPVPGSSACTRFVRHPSFASVRILCLYQICKTPQLGVAISIEWYLHPNHPYLPHIASAYLLLPLHPIQTFMVLLMSPLLVLLLPIGILEWNILPHPGVHLSILYHPGPFPLKVLLINVLLVLMNICYHHCFRHHLHPHHRHTLQRVIFQTQFDILEVPL